MSFLGSLGTLLGGVERQINPFDGGATYNNPNPQRQPIAVPNYHPATPPQVPNRLPIPVAQASDYSHIAGQAQKAYAAQSYNYTPMFQRIANSTYPGVVPSIAGGKAAGGYYGQPYNHVDTLDSPPSGYSLTPDTYGGPGYVNTHEFLHAAYERKTPQAQQQFLQLVQKNISPKARQSLSGLLSNPLYGHQGTVTDFTQLPTRLATEVHSFLPLYADSRNNPAISAYYNHYFNNDPGNQFSGLFGGGLTNKQTGVAFQLPRLQPTPPPQFSDPLLRGE